MLVLPLVELPWTESGGVVFSAVGVLTFLSVLTGMWVTVRRAKALGLDPDLTYSLLRYALLGAFAFSHVAVLVLDRWDLVIQNPWLWIQPHFSMSSSYVLMGGVLGILLWKWRGKVLKPAPYVDCLAYAFPFAWIFGRLGCTFSHDHKGTFSSFPLAVMYPDGARHNLGMYELFLITLIAIAFLWADKQHATRVRSTPYFFVAFFFCLYAPVRFGLDFLRVEGGRTLGLTLSQYLCIAGLAVGLYLLRRRR